MYSRGAAAGLAGLGRGGQEPVEAIETVTLRYSTYISTRARVCNICTHVLYLP